MCTSLKLLLMCYLLVGGFQHCLNSRRLLYISALLTAWAYHLPHLLTLPSSKRCFRLLFVILSRWFYLFMRLMNINEWRPATSSGALKTYCTLSYALWYESCDTLLCSNNKVIEGHPLLCQLMPHIWLPLLLALNSNLHPYPTSLPGGIGKRRLGVGGHALVSGCLEHSTIQSWTQIHAKAYRVITMQARPRWTDRQMDEHHGNCVTMRSLRIVH